MKKKIWCVLLVLEAALCVAFSISRLSSSAVFSAAIAFPFEQLGMGLRALSLSGTLGNIAAIVVYAAVSVLPLAFLLWRWLKKRLHGEDVLLVLLSALFFWVLYLMINPGDIKMFGGSAGIEAGKVLLGTTVYSVLCAYVVLRVLRLFFKSGTEKLQKYLSVMLYVLSAIFVYAIFDACFSALLDAVTSLKTGNQGNEQALGASYFFIALQFVVSAAPYIMDLWVVAVAGRLVSALRTDMYSEAAVAAGDSLSRCCKISLIVTLLTQILFNVLELLFVGSLHVVNSQIQIPVLSVVFVLAVLLFSRYLAESKRVKDDNDLFV